jgi:hypothetical protein
MPQPGKYRIAARCSEWLRLGPTTLRGSIDSEHFPGNGTWNVPATLSRLAGGVFFRRAEEVGEVDDDRAVVGQSAAIGVGDVGRRSHHADRFFAAEEPDSIESPSFDFGALHGSCPGGLEVRVCATVGTDCCGDLKIDQCDAGISTANDAAEQHALWHFGNGA